MSTLTTNYLAPSGREEAWRFTPLNRLAGILDAATTMVPQNSFTASNLPTGVTLENLAMAHVKLAAATTRLPRAPRSNHRGGPGGWAC